MFTDRQKSGSILHMNWFERIIARKIRIIRI
jgi:hypothetical protein